VLTLPTFDKNQGNINKAQSAYSQAYYNLQARLTALQSEVEQAATAFRSAHQAVTSINIGQATAAKNVRDKIAAAYAAGGRPLIEVLDTERAYRDTYRLLISGRANYWKSLNQLNAVAGTTVIEP
jgi:cobalt-zinc-cadmium efflux system outer membrane protein